MKRCSNLIAYDSHKVSSRIATGLEKVVQNYVKQSKRFISSNVSCLIERPHHVFRNTNYLLFESLIAVGLQYFPINWTYNLTINVAINRMSHMGIWVLGNLFMTVRPFLSNIPSISLSRKEGWHLFIPCLIFLTHPHRIVYGWAPVINAWIIDFKAAVEGCNSAWACNYVQG